MPKLLSPEVEGSVRALDKCNYSSREIVKLLKEQNIVISQTAVCNIIKNKGLNREAHLVGQKHTKKAERPIRTNQLVQKVKAKVAKEHPPSQRSLAAKFNCSLGLINKIIHEDCDLNLRRKQRVHNLLPRHKSIRVETSKRLLRGDLQLQKLEYVVTLDEAWLYLQETGGKTTFCYVKNGEQVPDNWTTQKRETFSQKAMVVAILTGRGVCPLIVVPPKVKIDAAYYIDNVLKPLVEQHLPKIYPDELDKVFIHHDAAPGHTATITTDFMNKKTSELGISFIKKRDIPVKSPDGSPLDFFGFGYLKQKLKQRRPRTIKGLVKTANEEWLKIEPETILNVFKSWRKRLKLIVQRQGNHIESVKNLHRQALSRINSDNI